MKRRRSVLTQKEDKSIVSEIVPIKRDHHIRHIHVNANHTNQQDIFAVCFLVDVNETIDKQLTFQALNRILEHYLHSYKDENFHWAYRFFDSKRGISIRGFEHNAKHRFHRVAKGYLKHFKTLFENLQAEHHNQQQYGNDNFVWKSSIEQIMNELNWDEYVTVRGASCRNSLIVLSPAPMSNDEYETKFTQSRDKSVLTTPSAFSRISKPNLAIKASQPFAFFETFRQSTRATLCWVDMEMKKTNDEATRVFERFQDAIQSQCIGSIIRVMEVLIRTKSLPYIGGHHLFGIDSVANASGILPPTSSATNLPSPLHSGSSWRPTSPMSIRSTSSPTFGRANSTNNTSPISMSSTTPMERFTPSHEMGPSNGRMRSISIAGNSDASILPGELDGWEGEMYVEDTDRTMVLEVRINQVAEIQEYRVENTPAAVPVLHWNTTIPNIRLELTEEDMLHKDEVVDKPLHAVHSTVYPPTHGMVLKGGVPRSKIPLELLGQKSTVESMYVCVPTTNLSPTIFANLMNELMTHKLVGCVELGCRAGYAMDALMVPLSRAAAMIVPLSQSIGYIRQAFEESGLVDKVAKPIPRNSCLSNFALAHNSFVNSATEDGDLVPRQHSIPLEPPNSDRRKSRIASTVKDSVVRDKLAQCHRHFEKWIADQSKSVAFASPNVEKVTRSASSLTVADDPITSLQAYIQHVVDTALDLDDQMVKCFREALPRCNEQLTATGVQHSPATRASSLHPDLKFLLRGHLCSKRGSRYKKLFSINERDAAQATWGLKFNICLELWCASRESDGLDPLPQGKLDRLLHGSIAKLQFLGEADLGKFMQLVVTPIFAEALPQTLQILYEELELTEDHNIAAIAPMATELASVPREAVEEAPAIAPSSTPVNTVPDSRSRSVKERMFSYNKSTVLGTAHKIRQRHVAVPRMPTTLVQRHGKPIKPATSTPVDVVTETPMKKRRRMISSPHGSAKMALFRSPDTKDRNIVKESPGYVRARKLSPTRIPKCRRKILD